MHVCNPLGQCLVEIVLFTDLWSCRIGKPWGDITPPSPVAQLGTSTAPKWHTHRTMCSFSTSAIPSLQVSAAHVFFHILSLICTKTVSGGLALFPQPRLCQNAWPSRGTTKSGLKRSTDRPPVVPPPVRYDWTRPGPPGPGRPTEPKRSYDWSLSSSHSAGRRSQNTIPRSHSLPKQLARVVPSSHLPQGHPFHGELLVGG